MHDAPSQNNKIRAKMRIFALFSIAKHTGLDDELVSFLPHIFCILYKEFAYELLRISHNY